MIRKTFKIKVPNLEKFMILLKSIKYLANISHPIENLYPGGIYRSFWGFIPMPMQMLAVLATTPLMKFNVPIAISMVWLSNPLTMPPMYYMEYLTGNFLLGRESTESLELSLEWFNENMSEIFVPLYVGACFYSIVVSFIIYLIINRLWTSSVHQERNAKAKLRKEKKEADRAPK